MEPRIPKEAIIGLVLLPLGGICLQKSLMSFLWIYNHTHRLNPVKSREQREQKSRAKLEEQTLPDPDFHGGYFP
jgi:hypothetical protein